MHITHTHIYTQKYYRVDKSVIGNCTLEQHSKNSEVNLLVSANLPDASPQPNDLKCSKTLFAVSILKKQFTDLAKSKDLLV